jgi:hypothetical protein
MKIAFTCSTMLIIGQTEANNAQLTHVPRIFLATCFYAFSLREGKSNWLKRVLHVLDALRPRRRQLTTFGARCRPQPRGGTNSTFLDSEVQKSQKVNDTHAKKVREKSLPKSVKRTFLVSSKSKAELLCSKRRTQVNVAFP